MTRSQARGRFRRTMLAVRLMVVPAALIGGWFLARAQGLELKPVGGPALLIAALFINQIAILLIGWRMRVGLRLFGIDIPMRSAQRIAIQSQFYFFFVPVSASNEVSRYLKIKGIRPETSMHALVVSLLFDRVMGLLACIVIALAVLPMVGFVPIAGFSVAPQWLALSAVTGGTVAGLVAWKLGWLRRLREAIEATRGQRQLIVPAALLVLWMQAATIASVWCAARWLGLDAEWSALAFGISVGTLGQVIPFTFAGAGPAEVAGTAVFIALGAPPVEAATLAALVYMTRLMAALQGGLWEVFDGLRAIRPRTSGSVA
ncbi:MAG: flippase-like domain-containing protein [Phycisphaeraceae bacterium]|nr:flippase-like domain-containing protein [Phycisphaeraceae bacterium]